MRPILRILAAVKDPTARSLPAVQKAAQLARALGASLELFHVVDSSIYVDMLGITGNTALQMACDVREQCRQQLERHAARVRLHTRPVTIAVEADHPAYEAIVRRAMSIGADLIVAQRHARRSIAPGLLRLADWELLRLSPVPVLLVKTVRPYRRPSVLAALDPRHAFGKPAQLDEDILQAAAVVAEALKGRLHAMHAYHGRGDRQASERVASRLRASAQEASRQLNATLHTYPVPLARRHLQAGPPCEAISRVAREVGADIVAAGAISRSGLRRAAFGNTAELLLDSLPCDLLVIKPRQFTCPVPAESRGVRLCTSEPLG